MKNLFKKLLYSLLGQTLYLKVLNTSFFFLYRIGALKNNPTYKFHYFTKKLIRKGDVIIDLGANLGYFTKLFATWTGKEGKVYAIEPIKPYNEILRWRTNNNSNVVYMPYALGTEEKKVQLVVPNKYGYLRTGLPRIYDNKIDQQLSDYEFSFEAEMKKGSVLLGDIPCIDFIKCDIEGYEEFVFPEIKNILMKHKPIIQVETWGEHEPVLDNFLYSLGYKKYELEKGKLIPTEKLLTHEHGDVIFVHPQNNSALLAVSN